MYEIAACHDACVLQTWSHFVYLVGVRQLSKLSTAQLLWLQPLHTLEDAKPSCFRRHKTSGHEHQGDPMSGVCCTSLKPEHETWRRHRPVQAHAHSESRCILPSSHSGACEMSE